MSPQSLCGLLLLASCSLQAGTPKFPKFKTVEIDSHIEIGYGVNVADVDGDGKPDILLADKKQFVWYQNPTWTRHVLAENLTPLDDVCIAAADVDDSGKASIAVGAQWDPSDTVNSGAVFYLIPPADRTQKWEPRELPHEPTTHRMRWMRTADGFVLIVAPLHGRGNQGGQGEGVRIMSYQKPQDPRQPWKAEVISSTLHMTHNFDLFKGSDGARPGLWVAAKEGVFEIVKEGSTWTSRQVVGDGPGAPGFAGAGEVRAGRRTDGGRMLATIEPMHGTQLAVYSPDPTEPKGLWKRQLLDDSLQEGHALACGDLLGNGFDQIVVGWRGKNKEGKVGIKVFSCAPDHPDQWSQRVLDDAIACEDLCLADLDNDGKLDVIASGRATKSLKIYLNQGPE